MIKPGDFAAGIEIRKKTGVAVPTLQDKQLTHVINTFGPGGWRGPDRSQSPAHQAEEILIQACHAYGIRLDGAKRQYEATRNLQTVFEFIDREPLTLRDPWILSLYIERHQRWDHAAIRGFERALTPKRPLIHKGGNPRLAYEYYRWLRAQVIQEILSGRQGKLEQIIAVVEIRPEAETKRKEAGLKPAVGNDRGRQIYYDTKAFCWTLIVMAGLNLIRHEAPEGCAC